MSSSAHAYDVSLTLSYLALGTHRQVLVSPLCKLLRSIISGVWPVSSNEEDASMEEAAAKKERDSAQAGTVINIHHLLLMILDFIARDLVSKEENSKVRGCRYYLHSQVSLLSTCSTISITSDFQS